MSFNKKHFTAFNKYFSGTITPAERKELEKEMLANPKLFEAFEQEQLLRGIKQENVSAQTPLQTDEHLYEQNKLILQAYLDGKKEQEHKPTAVLRRIPVRMRWAAAAIFILMGATIAFLVLKKKEPGDRVVVKKQDPVTVPRNDSVKIEEKKNDLVVVPPKKRKSLNKIPDELRTKLVTDGKFPFSLQNPVGLLAEGKPKKALEELDAYTGVKSGDNREEKKNRVYISFYRGICLFELDSIKEAITELKKTQSDLKLLPILADDTRWYLAMAYLKQNQEQPAVKLLNEIKRQTNDTDFINKAARALELLKE